MKYTTLPNTDLEVSRICLGSMTWGEQNTEQDAHDQLDYAIDEGVNFIDTAEMYAIPASKKTQGLTESYIGSWLDRSGMRDRIVLATKIVGPSRGFKHIREKLDFSMESLEDALHNSLRRLKTDYIDLYQLHWPERSVNIFGKRDYDHTKNESWEDNLGEILDRLSQLVEQGKVRYIGVSNETPFGLMRYMEEHRKGKLKMVSVQNSYNLLQRRDEIALKEVLMMEEIGYLAYSPLAFGVLSGKFLNGARPANSRVTLFPSYNRYSSDISENATAAYAELAERYGLSLAQLALAFVNQQDFVTANIIGATNLEQLSENIGSIDIELSAEVLKEIDRIHARMPNPAP